MQAYLEADTIVAPASALAPSAIAVLRLSGPQAWDLARQLLAAGTTLQAEARLAQLVSLDLDKLLDSGPGGAENRRLEKPAQQPQEDRAVLTLWAGPRSYTGEDMAELQLHGSPLLLRLAVQACLRLGARLAEAGEFTYRACLAGKLDLTQAEAVNELIHAGSQSALRLASAALAGLPSARLKDWNARLLGLLAGIEVIHDYAADDLDASLDQSTLLTSAGLHAQLELLAAEMREALRQSERSAPLRSGISVAICGPPNVGKSTLFNALLGHERSITAPQPGTTRDYITAGLEEQGLSLKLVDTAGYRDTADAIEAAGVRLAADWARSADLLLWVNAADAPPAELPAELAGGAAVKVITRCDLLPHWPVESAQLCVSGISGRGLDRLRERLIEHVASLGEAALDSFNQRQAGQIQAALSSLEAAIAGLARGVPMDAASLDIYRARELLQGIYEHSDRAAVVNSIFASFCVGK
ncbi:50S ribosome-binding GTPase [bacterium]|nr:50S ribosome-binding GTPase [bacterium]